jgi:formate hydrogenlyase subunit 3/multisubunit Na+/H+ antiporter MnhD subunit
MTVMLNLYVVLYIITLLCLQLLIKNIFTNKINTVSLPHMIYYIIKFSKYKIIFFLLIFSLTGIPPFLFFFIKFNYLLSTLSKFDFITITIIFMIFFLNMLFYIQFFLIKNIKFDMEYIKLSKKKVNFHLIYFINSILMLNFFSIFFFQNIYYTFYLLG